MNNTVMETQSEVELSIKMSIDVLTIIFIHVVVSQNQSSMNENPLLKKLLKLDLFNIVLNLVKIDNLQLREHSLKILQLMITVSPEFSSDFKTKYGYQLLAKIIKDGSQVSCFTMCHTILNCILDTYDNPNDIRPVGNALVQQVMNKSKIAKEIVNQTNKAINKPRKMILKHFDFFEFFFESITMLNNNKEDVNLEQLDKSRCQIFKMFSQYLNETMNSTQSQSNIGNTQLDAGE